MEKHSCVGYMGDEKIREEKNHMKKNIRTETFRFD